MAQSRAEGRKWAQENRLRTHGRRPCIEPGVTAGKLRFGYYVNIKQPLNIPAMRGA